MKVALSTFAGILFTLNAISQISVKPKVVGNPNFYSSNNTVVLETGNLSPNGYFTYDDSNAGMNEQVISIQDTLYNFGIDIQYALLSGKVTYYSSNGYISHYQLYSTVVLPKFNYTISTYTEPSSPAGMDGSITLTFDSVVPFNTLVFQHRDDLYDDTTVIDEHTIRFDSLSANYLGITLGNTNDATDYVDFRIYIGNPNHIYVNTGMDMNLTVIHADNNCEGILLTQATNFQDQLYNVWSDSVYNQFNRTSLCPGIYSVYTYDLVNGFYHYGSIDTMIVTNNYMAYIDSSIFNYTPQDTAYFNFLNCEFDFNSPIDSINYSEDTLFINGATVIVGFEFIVYQGNNFVTLTDTLIIGEDSLITMDVVLYCGLLKNTFNGRRIAYLRGAPEHHFFQNSDLGISNATHSSVELYPNPVTKELFLTSPLNTNNEIVITNLFGQVVLKAHDQTSIDVSDLANGLYVIRINQGTDQYTQKFLKE